MTNAIDVERTFVTMGTSFTQANWGVDFLYLHGDGERDVTSLATANNAKYTKTTNEYRLAGQYRF